MAILNTVMACSRHIARCTLGGLAGRLKIGSHYRMKRFKCNLSQAAVGSTANDMHELLPRDSSAENVTIDFSNPEIVYRTKRTSKLIRALFVLQLSGYDVFVKNSVKLMSISKKVLGNTLFNHIMRRSFFSQFAIEEKRNEVEGEVRRLAECGISSILATTAEEDIGEEIDFYNEQRYDSNQRIMSQCFQLVKQLCHMKGRPFIVQLKMTSYIKADVLEKLSKILQKSNCQFNNSTSVSTDNFVKGLNGELKSISELDEDEMLHIRRALLRVNIIAKQAVEYGIIVMVDAEKTNINPCISLISLSMMKKYNQEKANIWNTYQCYLKDAFHNMTKDADIAEKEMFCFGVKLVRGAYMEGEQEIAINYGREDPVNPTYGATNVMYDKLVHYLMCRCVRPGNRETRFIIASHNEESIQKAVCLMKELGIPASSGLVLFGQLYGMCDHVSYALARVGYLVYKSIVVGRIEDVLPYLSRRATENNTIFHRLTKEKMLLRMEIRRRLTSAITKAKTTSLPKRVNE